MASWQTPSEGIVRLVIVFPDQMPNVQDRSLTVLRPEFGAVYAATGQSTAYKTPFVHFSVRFSLLLAEAWWASSSRRVAHGTSSSPTIRNGDDLHRQSACEDRRKCIQVPHLRVVRLILGRVATSRRICLPSNTSSSQAFYWQSVRCTIACSRGVSVPFMQWDCVIVNDGNSITALRD
jgi:hypothetical protein